MHRAKRTERRLTAVVEALDGGRGGHGIQCVCVVVVAEPAPEDLARPFQILDVVVQILGRLIAVGLGLSLGEEGLDFRLELLRAGGRPTIAIRICVCGVGVGVPGGSTWGPTFSLGCIVATPQPLV